MPITNVNPIKAYTGNGVSNSFAYPFRIFAATDLVVTIGGVLQVYGVDYAVTGVGDPTGGAVVFAAPPANLSAVVSLRAVPYDRSRDYQEGGDFLADAVDEDLDRTVAQIQQLNRDVLRAIKVPTDVLTDQTIISSIAQRIGKLVGFDGFGNATLFDPAVLVNGAAVTAYMLTVLAAANALSARRLLGVQGRQFWCGTATGTANALTLTPADAVLALQAGDVLLFKSAALNTGATTINVSGLGAIAAQNGGNALVGGEIEANKWYRALYDGAVYQVGPMQTKVIGTAGRVSMVDTAQPDKLRFADGLRQKVSGMVQAVNAGDPINDTDISAGVAMDSTGSDLLELTALITKRLDANWAAGTNQGGLDTGVKANSTWYYLHAIKRPDTGVVDVLYSTSASAPTMPANYTLRKLVGCVLTDGAGSITTYHAYELAGGGLEVMWDFPTFDLDLANTVTTTRRLDTFKVPTSFSTIVHFNMGMTDATLVGVYMYCPDLGDMPPASGGAPMMTMRHEVLNQQTITLKQIRANASGQIATRGGVATHDIFRVSTLGFEWSRT